MPTSTGTLTTLWKAERLDSGATWYLNEHSSGPLPWSRNSDGSEIVYPVFLYTLDTPISAGATVDSAILEFEGYNNLTEGLSRIGVENSANPTGPTGDGSGLLSKSWLYSADADMGDFEISGQIVPYPLTSVVQALVAANGEIDSLLIAGFPASTHDEFSEEFESSSGVPWSPTLVIEWTAGAGGGSAGPARYLRHQEAILAGEDE